jgi:hypothetical protein
MGVSESSGLKEGIGRHVPRSGTDKSEREVRQRSTVAVLEYYAKTSVNGD